MNGHGAEAMPAVRRAAPGRWIVVSDVHLDVVPSRRDGAGGLATFLGELAETEGTDTTLVLLGDVFELLAPVRRDEAVGLARLSAVLEANPHVVAGLRRCVLAGIAVVVVPGNHDIDLVRPGLVAHLRARVGGVGDAGLRVQPWHYAVAGVLYAEHGNQHHDLNRFPHVLAPFVPARPDEVFAPPLARVVACGGPGHRALTLLGAVAATCWTDSRLARWPARTEHGRQLVEHAHAAGIEPELVEVLDRCARLRVRRTVRRLGRLAAGRLPLAAAPPPDRYLLDAAERLVATDARIGATFPHLVFGHTHVARDVLLGDGTTRYLNCGTWSDHVKPDGRAVTDPDAFPYVEIDHDGHDTLAGVRWWRPPDRRTSARLVPITTGRTP